jgi:putative endonuclease
MFGRGGAFAFTACVSDPKRFVYILKSLANPMQYYTGVTSDLQARLVAHNEGLSPHTAEFRPWRTLVVIEFDEEEPALEFERYLKSGSGREFARRHLRQTSSRAPKS